MPIDAISDTTDTRFDPSLEMDTKDARIPTVVKTALKPPVEFDNVLKDSRLWAQLGDIQKSLQDDPIGAGNPKFLFGAATCTYQDSAVRFPDSQWTPWQQKAIKDPANRSSPAADLVTLYSTPEGRKAITDRLHKLSLTSYRFSIEWSAIQPAPGVWNFEHLAVIIALCKHLRNEGIAPFITFHHFSEPDWFHKLGSFEKEENNHYFVEFCQKVFPQLTQEYQGRPLVEHFCTINEPAIEAFSRYVYGSFSPGYHGNFERAGRFLKGAFKAHEAVYEALKKDAPPSVQIGLVHQYLRFIPTNVVVGSGIQYLTLLTNEVSLKYFKTGKFELKVPFLCNIAEEGPRPKFDFIGVQYYARPVIGLTGPTSYHEPMTQMPFREDPEGIKEAIVETHKATGKPVIVTENGISTHDPVQRNRYMLRALYATREAAKVIGEENFWGYFVWSFGDNLEWDMGMKPQAFGLYALTEKGLALDPKPGTETLQKVAEASKRALQPVAAAA